MYEVEAKVALNPSQYETLKKQLTNTAIFRGIKEKHDTYYSDPKKSYMRLREEGLKNFFNLKSKHSSGGVEQNLEIEWEIREPTAWKNFLKKIGILPSTKKSKRTDLYQLGRFNIELNHVKTLGHFLEIETLVKEKDDAPKAKEELIEIFKTFGFGQKDFEKRYYLDLLKA